ncbi:MAG: RidA family protein [Lentisphaeria bacterium]|nr:RidA family protein [Lentisphaeria bacterium]NQZ69388.1 RidA family protein [Lentisphaeria bacterium]
MERINAGAVSDLPFCSAVKANGFVFVSGQASVDSETGAIINGSFEEEMRRSIANLKAVLEASGSSLDQVINIKSYVQNQDDIKQYNEIYREYFSVAQPSRSTIINCLGTMLLFELDCIALYED